MSFVTKKYTRPVLRKELKKLNADNFKNLNTLAKAISPRTGTKSAKVAALQGFVGKTKLKRLFSYVVFVTKDGILDALKN